MCVAKHFEDIEEFNQILFRVIVCFRYMKLFSITKLIDASVKIISISIVRKWLEN